MSYQLVIFFLNIEIKFSKPMNMDNETGCSSRPIAGCFQEFGCTARSLEEAKRLVEEIVRREFQPARLKAVVFTRCAVIASGSLSSEILSDDDIVGSPSFKDPKQRGVWYRSGHGFYPCSIWQYIAWVLKGRTQ